MSHRSAESTTYHQGQSGIPAVPAPVANDGRAGSSTGRSGGSTRGPSWSAAVLTIPTCSHVSPAQRLFGVTVDGSAGGLLEAPVGHLASAKAQLEEAKKQLRDLQSEWAENVRLKENLRKELASVEKAPGNADHPSMIELKEQVEQLVLDNTQGLEEKEDTYKEEDVCKKLEA
ncbi:hypothetical protein ACHAPX_010504 [Trichoderma viride]